MSEENISPNAKIKTFYLIIGFGLIGATIYFLFLEEAYKLGYTFLFMSILVTTLFEAYRAKLNGRGATFWVNLVLSLLIVVLIGINSQLDFGVIVYGL
ncbi:hypothetical protein [Alkalibacillus almallahensis]|uniref:hypothetical protein n=1 Tax=Alkalibacillus almallahensis TaxID=1379154 RepID=UPI00142335A3|nr:hypothetical protein [Alkalibacillus almallahensis]NIK13194.1 hypothetical protein [Alkalibacillus almallahensis]